MANRVRKCSLLYRGQYIERQTAFYNGLACVTVLDCVKIFAGSCTTILNYDMILEYSNKNLHVKMRTLTGQAFESQFPLFPIISSVLVNRLFTFTLKTIEQAGDCFKTTYSATFSD